MRRKARCTNERQKQNNHRTRNEKARLQKKLLGMMSRSWDLAAYIVTSRVLDTRNRKDSSKDSFSPKSRDRRINFASTISDDVKLISRVFSTVERVAGGGDGRRRDRKRDYFSNGKCHFPVYTTSARFLSFGRFRGKHDRNFLAKKAKKIFDS